MLSLFTLLALALLAPALAENATLSDPVTGATARVLGQSGKIDFELDDQTMQVTIRSLTEVDASGDAVGTTGPAASKHSFNSFASKDFEFSDIFSQDFQSVATTRVNFTCTLFEGETTLQVQLILFLEDGSITVNNVSYVVGRGSFKYSYYMNYWPFCTVGGTDYTDCTKGSTQEEGAYLDFEIIMKGGDSATPSVSNTTVDANGDGDGNSSSSSYSVVDWSDGASMVFPGEYETVSSTGERVWLSFPAGYPLFTEQGSQDVTTLRFARFDSGVEYDPLVSLQASGGGDSSAPATRLAFGVTALVTGLLSVSLML